MTSTDAIHSRGLLVYLSISTWTARRYDKKITNDVIDKLKASQDAGRWNKMLLPGEATDYKNLMALASNIRAAHYEKTLPWSEDGWRFVTSDDFMQYASWFAEVSPEFEQLADQFYRAYPSLKDQAKTLLNGSYKESDYPSASDMRKKFRLTVDYKPIPIESDIRVSLTDEQINMVQGSIRSQLEVATKTAMQDIWRRMHEVVKHMADKLSEPDAIFRDSLVKNIIEVCDSIEHLNFTKDADITAMRDRIVKELTRSEPELIREVPDVRKATAKRAEEILSSMKAFYS